MHWRSFIIGGLLASWWLLPGQASASHHWLAELDVDEAVSRARDRVDGRVISAEPREQNGRRSYNIRILTREGQVRRLQLDAETGKPIEKRRHRPRRRD